MAARELVVLGTASQVPTRYRNHNGYVLRWDDEAILFDPGEGTQRQLTLAGVSTSTITAICITHFHGDHCLGLPGVLARFALDQLDRPVDLYFPAGGAEYVERLRHAAIFDDWPHLRLRPVAGDGQVAERRGFTLHAARLDHGPETLGWRIVEPDSRRILPDRLTPLGITGPDVGRLQHDGFLDVDGRRVALDEVSEHRRGQRFAFVMDTRSCDNALALAEEADLLVCESTFLDGDEDLARHYGHLTAREAAWIAVEARARRLVLSHFSQRYHDDGAFLEEATRLFPDVVVAKDLTTVAVPARP